MGMGIKKWRHTGYEDGGYRKRGESEEVVDRRVEAGNGGRRGCRRRSMHHDRRKKGRVGGCTVTGERRGRVGDSVADLATGESPMREKREHRGCTATGGRRGESATAWQI
ncbi:hypothetical protein E2562_016099 [Oryza meyeriana var. granulata]|uniref:Uncharacterized protein n=1 Tax=Oryza meyeriana var. granulata TaxID=110450 RepID=A0A6G1BLG0_9ORYZ|nr:hypothetical protein E2562_016099 [Oryza meyeriana var. granulata]